MWRLQTKDIVGPATFPGKCQSPLVDVERDDLLDAPCFCKRACEQADGAAAEDEDGFV